MPTVLGTCHHDCPDTCGWVATVEDGVAVSLRGNPDHPYSRGELCPKVNRFLDRVYSEDRLLHPLMRVGPKGSAEFRAVSWDEALAHVADRVHAVRDEFGGEAIYPWWDAGTQGLIQESSLDRRLFAALGASQRSGSVCGAAAAAGASVATGRGHSADPMDIRHAKLILLWATNTRLTNRHLWPFIEEARRAGAEVVVIDPIRTVTADAADWFIQPMPGTDIALMLAMMHVLVRDGLVDTAYIRDHADGFESLAARVAEWPPERAAEVCRLDVGTIERLATAYGTTRPAFIRTLIGAEHHERGAEFYRTLACLPVLTGSWRDLGGGFSRSVGVWSETSIDYDAVRPAGDPRREINMNHLGRVLTDPQLDPPVKVLFVWNGNPLVTIPNASQIRSGLEREDLFTVVSEQFMTDTARYADVVFPATTQLEQSDVVASWGHLYLGWNEPAIEPLGEAVPNTELWRRLAAALGFDDADFHRSDRELLEMAMPEVDLDVLRRDGFVRVDAPEPMLPYADGNFHTPSGKADLGITSVPDYIPAAESPVGDPALASRFPLVLLSPKQHIRFLNASYTHLPKHGPLERGPFVELNPVDAEARHLADGDRVTVHNDRGALELPAKVSDRVRAGVVAIPFGWWAADHPDGQTVNVLTSDTLTDRGGGVAYLDTLVEVTPTPI